MQGNQPVTIAQAMEIALAHHRAGRLGEAEGIYRQVLRNDANNAPAAHLLGVTLFQTGRRQEGIAFIRRALQLQPNYPEALANLGHLLRECGQLDQALDCCRRAIQLNPRLAEAYVNLGSVLYSQEKFAEAADAHRKAISLRPEFADAHTNLGNALYALGMTEESVAEHRRAIACRPDFAEGYNNLGAGLHAMGKIDEAMENYHAALKLRPDYPEAMSNLGHALLSKKKFDEAIALCRRSIQIQPSNPDAYNNLGNAIQEKGDVDQAIQCFRQALQQRPDHPDAINNLGNCLQEQGNLEEAIPLYRRAIELRPLFAKAYGNLGNALRGLGKLDESIAVCRKAVELQPTLEEAHVNLGTALHLAGQYEPAMAECHAAIAIRKEFPEAHKDLALMLLVQGRFEQGWREYEWRLRLPNYFNSIDRFRQPMWDGSDFQGKTLLVHAEQGLGDTIHFARFLPMVAKMGGKIVLECQSELVRLMKQTQILAGVQIVPRQSKAGPSLPFDLHCPLMSLPFLLRRLDPSRDDDVIKPPYMKEDSALKEQWRTRLPSGGRLKVGLAWAGSKTNKNDRHRSITLATLAPLARANVDFYNLQLGKPGLQAANPPQGMKMIDLTSMIGDFADTAALLSELDLVVSVDTAVVHLAGAMGKPVWVFLQFTPDFRWLLEGDATPWYPSMRLIRQTKFGAWNDLIERTADELAAYQPPQRPQD
ncbi:MAG: tetratricopeptide repeat protein [Tepidisphaeraceae bacterium]